MFTPKVSPAQPMSLPAEQISFIFALREVFLLTQLDSTALDLGQSALVGSANNAVPVLYRGENEEDLRGFESR